MTSQYQDIKLLSPYEQFLKNTASNTNGCDSGGVNTSGGCRKEVKILGKKLGTGIITSTEEGNVVEVIEEKTKLVRDPFNDYLQFGSSANCRVALVSL